MMTSAELKTNVDAFFETHLDSNLWYYAGDKEKVCQMAARDILALLPSMDLDQAIPGSTLLSAIGEQTVFLLRNYQSQTDGKVVMSESVEGVSASYALIGRNAGIAPRAQLYIDQLRRSRSVRLRRG